VVKGPELGWGHIYPVSWVERMEQSPPFREWLAEVERRRAAERAAEQEARRRVARRPAALADAFPGFRVFVNGRSCEWQVQIGVAHDMMAGAHIRDSVLAGDGGFDALVARGDETGDWTPLVSWLLEHLAVGNDRSRQALRFLAAGDPDGWRRWCEAQRQAA
jgi:hypothetical protein